MIRDIYGACFVSAKLWISLSLLMLIPTVMSYYMDDPDWINFGISSTIVFSIGCSVLLSMWGTPVRYSLRQGILTVNMLWISGTVAASIPFLMIMGSEEISLADAFFESTSGITTTGATIFHDIDSLPASILLWRSMLQWLGGVGIVLLSLILLPSLRIGGAEFLQLETSHNSEKPTALLKNYVGAVALSYGVISGLCLLSYYLGGMTFFDSVNHMMTTVSSGGFSTHTSSFTHYKGTLIPWIAILFMYLSAIPFIVFINIVMKTYDKQWNDPQVRYFIVSIVVVSCVMVLMNYEEGSESLYELMTDNIFNVVSLMTTTGFGYGDFMLEYSLATGLFTVFAFCGGCAGSTAGGCKLFRVIVVFRKLKSYLSTRARKHAVFPIVYGDKVISEDSVMSIFIFITVYFISIVVVVFLLSMTGMDIVSSVSGAMAMISNIGPGLGDVIGANGNYGILPTSAKWIMSVTMVLGRLEIMTMLFLCLPLFWKD